MLQHFETNTATDPRDLRSSLNQLLKPKTTYRRENQPQHSIHLVMFSSLLHSEGQVATSMGRQAAAGDIQSVPPSAPALCLNETAAESHFAACKLFSSNRPDVGTESSFCLFLPIFQRRKVRRCEFQVTSGPTAEGKPGLHVFASLWSTG